MLDWYPSNQLTVSGIAVFTLAGCCNSLITTSNALSLRKHFMKWIVLRRSFNLVGKTAVVGLSNMCNKVRQEDDLVLVQVSLILLKFV